MEKQTTVELFVFVIDDDDDVRASLKSLFKSVGLTVELFGSTDEFLDRVFAPGCCFLPGARRSVAWHQRARVPKRVGKGGYRHADHLPDRPWRHPDGCASNEGGGRRVSKQALPRSGLARCGPTSACSRPRKARGGQRIISVATARHDSHSISISLQDTGPGIDPNKLASIFDPFVTTKAKGTGLGLAICKMIIEQHGGKLSAASDTLWRSAIRGYAANQRTGRSREEKLSRQLTALKQL